MRRALTELERRWARRALLAHRVAAPQICERAVNEARLLATTPELFRPHGPRSLVAHIALHQRAVGITLGRHIYITRCVFDEQGDLPLSLVVHEVAHVAQYLNEGSAMFLARYLRDYAVGLAKGLSDREAYLAIPHEVEARRAERYITEHAEDEELRGLKRLHY